MGEAAGVWTKVVGKAALQICRLGAGGLVTVGERQMPPSMGNGKGSCLPLSPRDPFTLV
jgi:hypothetical protein